MQTNRKIEILATEIHQAILKKYQYEIPIFIKTIKEWKEIVDNNPFKNTEEKQQYFTFLSQIPLEKISLKVNSEDKYEIIKDVIYLRLSNGYGKTKLQNNFFERELKLKATTRNCKTIMKLLSMANNYN